MHRIDDGPRQYASAAALATQYPPFRNQRINSAAQSMPVDPKILRPSGLGGQVITRLITHHLLTQCLDQLQVSRYELYRLVHVYQKADGTQGTCLNEKLAQATRQKYNV